jgi:hypothetical protein
VGFLNSLHGSRAPISSRICDAVCVFAALWTIACHGAVARHGSLNQALLYFAVLAAVAIAALLFVRQRRSSEPSPAGPTPIEPDRPRALGPASFGQPAGALLGIAALLVFLVTREALVLWWMTVGVLSFALLATAWVKLQPGASPRPLEGWLPTAVLWTTGAVCAWIALSFHRPDYDSAFYVSLAVGAADQPSGPLMMDTMHGVEGVGLHQPAHRVHTFELFQGAISYITGVPVMTLYHIVLPALSAFLVPLAYARLFRILTPRYWPFSVLVVLFVLVGGGGSIFWYGDFSLARIINGKSVYMSVFLPLAYAYGLRFGAHPCLRHWGLLAAVQIAAVGCTSSALWSVPISACAALACSVRLDRNTWKTLAFGVLASSYVVVVGLTLIGDMQHVAERVSSDLPAAAHLGKSIARTLGRGPLRAAALAALLLCWAAHRRGTAQRFAIVVPLIVLTVVLNPYFEEEVGRYMTGPSFWRSMWSLPLPLLMALLLASPLQLGASLRQRLAAGAVAVLATAGFVAFVPTHSTLGEAHRTQFGELGSLKVSRGNFLLARQLVGRVPPGSMVVAPEPVAAWVPTFQDHPFIVSSREGYMSRIRAELGSDEVDRRRNMSELVSRRMTNEEREQPRTQKLREAVARRSRHPDPIGWFHEGLQRYGVRGVCIHRTARHYRAIVRILLREGFQKEFGMALYEVWVRSPEKRADLPTTLPPGY